MDAHYNKNKNKTDNGFLQRCETCEDISSTFYPARSAGERLFVIQVTPGTSHVHILFGLLCLIETFSVLNGPTLMNGVGDPISTIEIMLSRDELHVLLRRKSQQQKQSQRRSETYRKIC